MNPTPGSFAAIANALERGLPNMVPSFIATVALLAIGVLIYTTVTRFRERAMIAAGNTAAAILLAGVIVALAIPLAALLATSGTLIDIIVWGVVALALQLVTFAVISVVFRNFHAMIEANNAAAAVVVAATHLAVALLNAAVMVPT